MRKYFTVLSALSAFAIFLCLAGCQEKSIKKQPLSSVEPFIINNPVDKLVNTSDEIIINEQPSGDKGFFYIGMSGMDFEKSLSKLNLSITNTKIISDKKDAWNYCHKIVWVQNLCFTFNKENILYKAIVNSQIPTAKGLIVGNSVSKMKNLYGNDFVHYTCDWGEVFQYKIGENYFNVSVQNNIVILWNISKYEYEY